MTDAIENPRIDVSGIVKKGHVCLDRQCVPVLSEDGQRSADFCNVY